MTVYEMAKKYYPKYWDNNRLRMLVNAGRLLESEYQTIISEAKEETNIES